MSRGIWFITPKDPSNLSLHITDKELNEKLIAYGKRTNTNISLVGTNIMKKHIDEMLDELERSEIQLLNDEAKVDTILELKRKLKEAGLDA